MHLDDNIIIITMLIITIDTTVIIKFFTACEMYCGKLNHYNIKKKV